MDSPLASKHHLPPQPATGVRQPMELATRPTEEAKVVPCMERLRIERSSKVGEPLRVKS